MPKRLPTDARLHHRNSDLEALASRVGDLYFPDTRLQHRNPDLEDMSLSIEGRRPNLGTLEGVFSTSIGVIRMIDIKMGL